ncbi:MAG TPA: hypothetical protein VLM42_19015 [Bryobacteraceae bacterium]|nr:hypothetical protein [Bryobacteraceae bacterium]
MTKFARTIPKLTFLVPLLAALAAPTYASIAYTSCASGCTTTSGTYTSWQSATGSAGLTFSTSPNTFTAGNLSSGVYLDPTGTVFTGYSSPTTIDTNMFVSGSTLLQSVGGGGAGLEILLPANTYALAFSITTLSGAGLASVELGDHNLSMANYGIVIPTGGSIQFFSIISTTPLGELFVGQSVGGHLQLNDFEIGQESPTPELSSVTLMGSGLLLLGFLRRRIHKPNSPIA